MRYQVQDRAAGGHGRRQDFHYLEIRQGWVRKRKQCTSFPTQPTIGIDFLCRNITVEKRTYRLQLWDTAGQEKYKSLVPAYLRDANCAVFVVDVTRAETLDHLAGWIQLYRDHEKQNSKAVLMANKIDRTEERVLSSDTLADFAKK